jgi:hypothetical protein
MYFYYPRYAEGFGEARSFGVMKYAFAKASAS